MNFVVYKNAAPAAAQAKQLVDAGKKLMYFGKADRALAEAGDAEAAAIQGDAVWGKSGGPYWLIVY